MLPLLSLEKNPSSIQLLDRYLCLHLNFKGVLWFPQSSVKEYICFLFKIETKSNLCQIQTSHPPPVSVCLLLSVLEHAWILIQANSYNLNGVLVFSWCTTSIAQSSKRLCLFVILWVLCYSVFTLLTFSQLQWHQLIILLFIIHRVPCHNRRNSAISTGHSQVVTCSPYDTSIQWFQGLSHSMEPSRPRSTDRTK